MIMTILLNLKNDSPGSIVQKLYTFTSFNKSIIVLIEGEVQLSDTGK